MVGFRLAAKKIFLTYPRCNESKDELLEFLKSRGELKEYAICREAHEGGVDCEDDDCSARGYHLHALCLYDPRVDTTDSRFFDFKTFHPNIKKVGKRNEDWNNVLQYVQKEDANPLTCAQPRGKRSWGEIVEAENEEEFWQHVALYFPREYILHHSSLENYARKKFRKEEEYEPAFTEFNPPVDILDYLSGNFENPRPVRPKALILGLLSSYSVGPSRLGKTEWARSLGKHIYIQGQYSLDAFRSGDYSYIVWDDVPWDRVPGKKQFFGCQRHPFFLSDKYRGKQKITLNGALSIFLTNVYPDFGTDKNWFEANVVVIRISRPLF